MSWLSTMRPSAVLTTSDEICRPISWRTSICGNCVVATRPASFSVTMVLPASAMLALPAGGLADEPAGGRLTGVPALPLATGPAVAAGAVPASERVAPPLTDALPATVLFSTCAPA